MAVFFMNKEGMRLLPIDENAGLVVICHKCPAVLYETEKPDKTTQLVAQLSANGHNADFSEEHDVSIILGNQEIYHTDQQSLKTKGFKTQSEIIDARRDLLLKASEFVSLGEQNDVTNFIIEGPVSDSPTEIDTLVCLYPSKENSGEPGWAILSTNSDTEVNASAIYSRILGLNIPDRVKNLEIPDDSLLASTLKKRSAEHELPYIVLGFGNNVQSQKEVVLLFAISGVSPENALKELQTKARKRISGS